MESCEVRCLECVRAGGKAERKLRFVSPCSTSCTSPLFGPAQLAVPSPTGLQRLTAAQQPDRKRRMAERRRHRPRPRREPTINLGVVCFIFLLLERALSFLGNSGAMCMFQTAAALRRGSNLNSDVQKRKDNILKPASRSFSSLLSPVPTLPLT